jgi:hypothetical protein
MGSTSNALEVERQEYKVNSESLSFKARTISDPLNAEEESEDDESEDNSEHGTFNPQLLSKLTDNKFK